MHPSEYTLVNGKRVIKRAGSEHRDPHDFVVVSNGKVGVLLILKNASRSIFKSSTTRVSLANKSELPPEVHVFVREPIERLRSAYQFFLQRPPIINRRSRDKMTWQEFIDYVLSGSKNPHWRPVSETVGNVGSPVIPHLFENINKEYPLGTLETGAASNPVAGVDMTYRVDELRKMYAGDYALREQVAS